MEAVVAYRLENGDTCDKVLYMLGLEVTKARYVVEGDSPLLHFWVTSNSPYMEASVWLDIEKGEITYVLNPQTAVSSLGFIVKRFREFFYASTKACKRASHFRDGIESENIQDAITMILWLLGDLKYVHMLSKKQFEKGCAYEEGVLITWHGYSHLTSPNCKSSTWQSLKFKDARNIVFSRDIMQEKIENVNVHRVLLIKSLEHGVAVSEECFAW